MINVYMFEENVRPLIEVGIFLNFEGRCGRRLLHTYFVASCEAVKSVSHSSICFAESRARPHRPNKYSIINIR